MRKRKAGKSRWMSLVKKFGVVGAKSRYRRMAANPRKRSRRAKRSYRPNIWVDDARGHRKAALTGWARRKGSKRSKARRRYARKASRTYRFKGLYGGLMAANPRLRRRRRSARRYFRRNPGVRAAIAETKKTLSLSNLPYAAVGGAAIVGTWLVSNRLLKAVGLSDSGLVGFAGNVVTAGLLSGATAVVTSNVKAIMAVGFGGVAGAVARFLIEGLLMPQGIGGVSLAFAPTTGILSGLGAGGGTQALIQAAVRRQIAAQTGVAGYLPTSAYPGVSGWLPASGISEEVPGDDEDDDGSFDI